jgi:hypothetical protein
MAGPSHGWRRRERPREGAARGKEAVKDICALLSRIRDAEVDYMENIPENLCDGMAFEAVESCVNPLEAAIESLESAY